MPPRPRNLKLPLSAFAPSSPAAEEASAGPIFKKTIDGCVDVQALTNESDLAFEGWQADSGRVVAGGVAVVR